MGKEKANKEDKEKLKEQKLKEKERKQQEARLQKRLKKESKRIYGIVTFPFKTLFALGTVLAMISFLYFLIISNETLLVSLFKGFVIFTSVYLGLGLIFLIWFFVMAKVRQREMEERKRTEREHQREEEQAEFESKFEKDLLLREAEQRRKEELERLKERLTQSETTPLNESNLTE